MLFDLFMVVKGVYYSRSDCLKKVYNATPGRYDVERIPAQYKVEVKNKFQLLLSETEDEQTPNDLWEHMKEAV